MSPHPRTPAALVVTLEANGPGAILTRRAWNVLAACMRLVDPTTGEVVVSHHDLALRTAHRSTRTIARALAELVAAGLVDHHAGGRIGHGTTEVRLSRIRVWVEAVEVLLEDGRELVRRTREERWSITQARMRTLLDHRARARARRAAVGGLSGLLDVALEPHNRRSPVMDRKSVSPPGPGATGGPRGSDDPYIPEICPHDWQLSICRRCND